MARRVYFESVEKLIVSQNTDNDDVSGYEKRLRLKLLRSVLDSSLTKKQKCYIMLYYKDNKKISEIAEMFNVAPSTVSRTVNRARKNLYKVVTGQELYSRFVKN